MSWHPLTRVAAVAGTAVLAVTLTACSSSSDTESTVEPAASTAPAATSAPADEAPAEDTESQEDTPAEPAGALPELTDGEAPPERTVTVTSEALEPAELTVAVGDLVTFKAGDDGVHAVEVGGLDGATVTGGLIETFRFPAAGTYEVVETLTGNTAVITVQ